MSYAVHSYNDLTYCLQLTRRKPFMLQVSAAVCYALVP